MATAPQRSGVAESNVSRRVLGSPLAYKVGPCPAIRGWTSSWYSSIRSSRSSATPEHCPVRVHQAGEKGVRLVVGEAFLVVDATVKRDIDAEGQESHGFLRFISATSLRCHRLP